MLNLDNGNGAARAKRLLFKKQTKKKERKKERKKGREGERKREEIAKE